MRKVSLMIAMAIAFVFTSCGEITTADRALAQLNKTLEDYTSNPSSILITNVDTVFCNDSIAVLHCTVSLEGKDKEEKEDIEYIYLASGGKKYDSFKARSEYDAYVSKADYDKAKANTMYADQPYEVGMAYRAIVRLNKYGQVVGNDGERFQVATPTGTGNWERETKKDGSPYLRMICIGNGDVWFDMYVESNDLTLDFNDDDSLCKRGDEWIFTIIDKKGNELFMIPLEVPEPEKIVEMATIMLPPADRKPIIEQFAKVLTENAEVTLVAEHDGKKYQVPLNTLGFAKAFETLK